jgi:hypothetical protein
MAYHVCTVNTKLSNLTKAYDQIERDVRHLTTASVYDVPPDLETRLADIEKGLAPAATKVDLDSSIDTLIGDDSTKPYRSLQELTGEMQPPHMAEDRIDELERTVASLQTKIGNTTRMGLFDIVSAAIDIIVEPADVRLTRRKQSLHMYGVYYVNHHYRPTHCRGIHCKVLIYAHKCEIGFNCYLHNLKHAQLYN